MDRLAKKCVIASGIVHGTLVLVLIVGPAFLGSDEQKFAPDKYIDFVPYKTIEESLSGGGRPDVPDVPPPTELPKPPENRTQPVAQPVVQPRVAEPPQRPKDNDKSVKDATKEPQPDKDSLEVPKPKPANKIVLVRVGDKTGVKNKEAAKEARAAEDRKQKEIARNFDNATGAIRSSASGGVQIDLRGPGGGGIPYAGFNQALASTYMRNWIAPSDSADSGAKVIAAITLSRNGRVISSRITKPSGNADLDKSVQDALDKVDFVAPFPESVKDAQKTFHLEFDPKTKRMIG